MFETKIAKETLKCLGVIEPSKLDITRFIDRFKIHKLGIGKKLSLYVAIPAFRKFLDIKLEGVVDDK